MLQRGLNSLRKMINDFRYHWDLLCMHGWLEGQKQYSFCSARYYFQRTAHALGICMHGSSDGSRVEGCTAAAVVPVVVHGGGGGTRWGEDGGGGGDRDEKDGAFQLGLNYTWDINKL